MLEAHDIWARYYDYVYERTYGHFYERFTNMTLGVIQETIGAGTIIDFGAGTGRFSLPLKEKGYEIIAVEKSAGMTEVLRTKANSRNLDFPIYNCAIADYMNGDCDLALALFSVLSYATTEDELKKNIHNICSHIRPNGYFFFDLPKSAFFNADMLIDINQLDFVRRVTVLPQENNSLHTYHEQCQGIFERKPFRYEEAFSIRFWERKFVANLLEAEGLLPVKIDLSAFNGTGATYLLFQKTKF